MRDIAALAAKLEIVALLTAAVSELEDEFMLVEVNGANGGIVLDPDAEVLQLTIGAPARRPTARRGAASSHR
jgi:hypothetical protein